MWSLLRTAGRLSDRKARMVATASCRRVWHLLPDPRSREAVEVAEQYADGLTDRRSLVAARDEARDAKVQFVVPFRKVAWRAAYAAQNVTRDTGRSAAENATTEAARALHPSDTNHCDAAERAHQAALIRDIFGNPFRPPPSLEPRLLTPNVLDLARRAYYDRRLPEGTLEPALLAALAAALEAAGCTDAGLLGHLRSEGPHVRGCFALDAVLSQTQVAGR